MPQTTYTVAGMRLSLIFGIPEPTSGIGSPRDTFPHPSLFSTVVVRLSCKQKVMSSILIGGIGLSDAINFSLLRRQLVN